MNGPGLAKASSVSELARTALDELFAVVARLEQENRKLRAENDQLNAELNDALDTIHELRAMVERAHT